MILLITDKDGKKPNVDHEGKSEVETDKKYGKNLFLDKKYGKNLFLRWDFWDNF